MFVTFLVLDGVHSSVLVHQHCGVERINNNQTWPYVIREFPTFRGGSPWRIPFSIFRGPRGDILASPALGVNQVVLFPSYMWDAILIASEILKDFNISATVNFAGTHWARGMEHHTYPAIKTTLTEHNIHLTLMTLEHLDGYEIFKIYIY